MEAMDRKSIADAISPGGQPLDLDALYWLMMRDPLPDVVKDPLSNTWMKHMPTFGGQEPPGDTRNVWSWDLTRLIRGSSRRTLEIVTREEHAADSLEVLRRRHRLAMERVRRVSRDMEAVSQQAFKAWQALDECVSASTGWFRQTGAEGWSEFRGAMYGGDGS